MLSPEEIALTTFYKERKDAKSKQSAESEKAMLKRALQTKSMHIMVSTEPSSSSSGSGPRTDRPPSSVVPGRPTKEQMAKSAARNADADKTAKSKAVAATTTAVPDKGARRRRDSSSSSSSDSSEDEAEVRRKKRMRREQDQTSLDAATYAADGLLQTSTLDLTTATATAGKSGVLEWALPAFSFDRNQTVALKLTIPRTGRQNYAVNIAPEEGDEDLLVHFNPRITDKYREVILNHRIGADVWGGYVSKPLDDMPPLFDKTFELCVQMRPEGFCFYVDGVFATVFPYRQDLSKRTSLRLQVPIQDDRGSRYNARVHAVWWGRRANIDDAMLEDLAVEGVAAAAAAFGEDTSKALRTINITGLPYLADANERKDFESYLFNLFDGDEETDSFNPESVKVSQRGGAQVVFESQEMAVAAIKEHQGAELQNEDGSTTVMKMGFQRLHVQ